MSKSIQLCGAAWSFVGTTLQESVAIYRALGIRAVDLIAFPAATLDSQAVVWEPAKEAKRINDLDVRVGNLIFFFASDFSERAINHRDSTVRMSNVKEFRAVIEFCWRCSIPPDGPSGRYDRDYKNAGPGALSHLKVLIQTRMVNNS